MDRLVILRYYEPNCDSLTCIILSCNDYICIIVAKENLVYAATDYS